MPPWETYQIDWETGEGLAHSTEAEAIWDQLLSDCEDGSWLLLGGLPFIGDAVTRLFVVMPIAESLSERSAVR